MRLNWRVVFSITQKDLMDSIKNMYLLFAMVMPIVLSLMFGLLIPNQQEMEQIKIILYDPGKSRLAASVRSLTNLEISEAASEQAVQERLKSDKSIIGGLVIPPGFDAAVDAGQKPQLFAYVNEKAGTIPSSVFSGIVTNMVWGLVRQEFPAQVVWNDQTTPQQSEQSSGSEQGSGNMGFKFDQYMLNMLAVMALTMVGVFAVPALIVEEKEKHTMDVLLVAPGGAVEVTLGKAIVGMVYCAIIVLILMVLNKGFVGNWPVTLLALLLGALLCVGLGLLMGAVFKTMHQVNTWSSILMLLLLFPSWVGIFGLPDLVEKAMALIPTYYLSQVVQLAQAGKATLAGVWVNLVVLAACTLATYAGVIWLLRREQK